MPLRQVYHLGLHKTGSTSLQQALWAGRAGLAADGVLLPAVTPQARDLWGMPDRGKLPLNTYMGHNALAWQMIAEAIPGFALPPVHAPMWTVAEALAGVLPQARARGCDTLLFCSEDFARAGLMAPASPSRLAAAFGAADVTIAATLRRPDDALAAWQSQRLRFGDPCPALREQGLTVGLGSVQVEYRAALTPWLRTFPGAALQLMPYDVQRAAGGAIETLPALTGVALHNAAAPSDSNAGMHPALLEIARLGLHALPRVSAGALRRYLETARPRLDLPPGAQIELFAPGARQVLARAFADIHHWLWQVSGRVPFFADPAQIAVPRPIPELDAAAAALEQLRADAPQHLADEAARAFLDRLTLPAR